MAFFLWLLLFFCASLECRKEQRATIKSCAMWGFDAAHTIRSIQAAFEEHALSHTQIQHWLRVFQNDPGWSVSDAKCCGRPISQQTEDKVRAVEEIVLEDRRITSRQLGREAGMAHSTALKVLKKDLKYSKLAAKFIPHRLTAGQRRSRMDVCNAHLATIANDSTILNWIIAMDESWFYTYDPRNKSADKQWVTKEEPCPTKCLRERSQKKVMLILFFDSSGIISMDFVEDGTVDSDVYVQSLRHM